MGLITDDQLEFFRRNGYVKLNSLVSPDNCQAVIDAIYERLDADPDDPETWYTKPAGMDDHWESRSGGMVELSHHQSLWDNRQDPNVYQAFTELLDEEALWVSMDRCNMTPPAREEHPELDNSFLHWDADLSDEGSLKTGGSDLPYGLQGVLFLDDVSEDQGTFQCVPSVYRNLDEWYETHTQSDMTEEAYEEETVRVAGEAGDFVIWDTRLPHGNGSNQADAPRFAQYITMVPARFHDHEARSHRIERWRTLDPHGDDPSNWERRHLEPADLTSLGDRLLGLAPWDGWSRST